MKINIIFNGIARMPVGGYKVVFEYANQLIKKGNEVCIYFLDIDFLKKFTFFPSKIRTFGHRIKVAREPKWFDLDKKIEKKSISSINDFNIENADITMCTSADTAIDTSKLSPKKGEKIYFIQGYEDWKFSERYLRNTYKLDMKKVVVSEDLRKMIKIKSGMDSFVLVNGVNLNDFYPVYQKKKAVTMMFHKSENKGSKYGIEVIEKIHEMYPELKINIFSSYKKNKKVPKYVDFYYKATPTTLRKLFNESYIYIYPSLQDGFGLTIIEAMACGCSVVSTKYKGIETFAMDNQNILLSPLKDVDAMFENCIKILNNVNLRKKIESEAKKTATKFSLDQRSQNFIDLLTSIIE